MAGITESMKLHKQAEDFVLEQLRKYKRPISFSKHKDKWYKLNESMTPTVTRRALWSLAYDGYIEFTDGWKISIPKSGRAASYAAQWD